MLPSFLTFLAREQLITDQQQTTLLAVSGGVDSVVLAYLFKKAALPFAIAHCNFNLRGAEAEATSLFVEELATSYQVPFYTTRFATKDFACNHKISIQMAARNLRYEFFGQLLQQHGWHQIATGHHWDDAIETMLLNFIKGTSIKGLYGMAPIRPLVQTIPASPSIVKYEQHTREGQVIRPLLFARKKEIITYAKQEKLHWHEDSSNKHNHYQRNLLRNKVIPLLHQINPNFETTTQESATKLREIGTFFDQHIYEIKKKISAYEGDIHYLAIDQIIDQPWAATVAFELLRPYGFSFKQIKSLITNPIHSGKMTHATDYTLYIDRKNWLVKAKKPSLLEEKIVTPTTKSMVYGPYTLHFHIYNTQEYILQPTGLIAALDYHKLKFPLIIRPWQAGDFFYPMGMKGRKKISDLLIDLKIPIALKKEVCVMTSSDQIIWVVGHRIDERFKVKKVTKEVFTSSLL